MWKDSIVKPLHYLMDTKNVVKVNFPSQLASLAFLVDESPIHEKYANYVPLRCLESNCTVLRGSL